MKRVLSAGWLALCVALACAQGSIVLADPAPAPVRGPRPPGQRPSPQSPPSNTQRPPGVPAMPACSTGLTACMQADSRWACVDLHTDVSNCGQCGNACSGPRAVCNNARCDYQD